MKKALAILLVCLLILSQTVFALTSIAPGDSTEHPLPKRISGFIVEEMENGSILVESGRDGSSVILNMEQRPYIVDAVTGDPIALEDRIDDYIIAYYGPVEARSFPPMSNPILIICNLPADYIAPSFWRVESIVERTDNEVRVMVDNGGLIVTIDSEAPLAPYLTRQFVTLDTIDIGAELLLWYPMVALSFPGQAMAQKALYFGTVDMSSPGDGAAGIVPPIAELEVPEGYVVGEMFVGGEGVNFGGRLPIFYGADLDELNIEVTQIFENTVGQLKEGETIHYDYMVHYYGNYTSVLLFVNKPGEASSDETLYTFVLRSEDFSRLTFADIFGPNAYKLANKIISREIAENEEGAFFTGAYEFHGLTIDPSFFVNEHGEAILVFGKQAISAGVTGNPIFTTRMGVVNHEITVRDTFTENGVVFVPLRAVATVLGYSLSWDGATQTIELAKDSEKHTLVIGEAQSGGKALPAAPKLRDSRTYVPLAFFELSLGAVYLTYGDLIVVSALDE